MHDVNFFWAYGNLNALGHLSIKSFIANGFSPRIWTYGDIADLPAAATLCDARDILPEALVFKNQLQSYASFADLFRYELVTRKGGLYSDTDVVCLKPATRLPTAPFLVTQRVKERAESRVEHGLHQNSAFKTYVINQNIFYSPSPEPGDVMDLARVYSHAFPKEKIHWQEIGPRLITAIVGIYPNHGFTIMPPAFANPIDYWNCPFDLIEPGRPFPDDAMFLHLYGQMWRQAGIDFDQEFHPDSIMGICRAKYI